MQAKQKLIGLQKKLYERAYADAHDFAFGSSRTMAAYAKSYDNSLPNRFIRIESNQLVNDLAGTRILLYGDFHSLKQSQKGLLRILREYRSTDQYRPISLGLEAFRAADRRYLQAYFDKEINDDEFLRKTKYHARWGFPWPNFRMLIDFARENEISIFGINTAKCGKDPLTVRDRFAAKRLFDRANKDPDELVIGIIGEYHLADNHLPAALKKLTSKSESSIRTLRVVTNVDRYFFDLNHGRTPMSTEYLYLKDDLYCLMNSPPWIKWQSFTLWEEMRSMDETSEFDDEFIGGEYGDGAAGYTEYAHDLDYHFLTFAENIRDFLGAELDSHRMANFNIVSDALSDTDNRSLESLDFGSSDDGKEITIALDRANVDGVHFVNQSSTVLLTTLSVNNLSEAAGQYVHTMLTDFSPMAPSPAERFFRRIIKYAVGMVASKMLNPKRKCMTIRHFQTYIRHNHRKRLHGHPRLRRDAYREALKFHDWMQKQILGIETPTPIPPRSTIVQDENSSYEISRAIGLLLGYNLYSLVISSRVTGRWLACLFTERLESLDETFDLVVRLYRLLHKAEVQSNHTDRGLEIAG